MSFDVPKVPAFKDELKLSKHNKQPILLDWEGPWSNKLTEFKRNGQFVIRKSRDRREEKTFDPELEGNIAQRAFSELRDKYHIDAPVHFVVAHDETSEDDKPDLFVLTEKVKPADVSKMKSLEREHYLKETIALLENLVTYFEDKFSDKRRFLADLARPDQYVYGNTPGNTKNK